MRRFVPASLPPPRRRAGDPAADAPALQRPVQRRFRPGENLGFGAEYGYSRIVLHPRKRNRNANLDMKLDGPSLFVRFRFQECGRT